MSLHRHNSGNRLCAGLKLNEIFRYAQVGRLIISSQPVRKKRKDGAPQPSDAASIRSFPHGREIMGQLDHNTMCTLCRTLPLSKPRTHLHVNMEPLTEMEDFGVAGLRRLYRCSVCFTHWLYQKDRWESCQGFKLWDGNLESYREHSPAPSPARGRFAPVRIFRGAVH